MKKEKEGISICINHQTKSKKKKKTGQSEGEEEGINKDTKKKVARFAL